MPSGVINVITACLNFVTTISGSYAALKLAIYAIGYMQKNPQKIQEAKDGMINVAIGLAICLSSLTISQWLQGNLKF
ncbi:pilin [Sporolactobacillus shoreicorticis]|uniref:Pilin n=1 Tax=Sporolactobacillus shoreicorticis TaxID=1923877 RepID=A0ABW5S8J3_9BACL|nr:pilin [Sporolactobacillus shoreicorticis]MCO7126154.1 pilin [Sporolactobacillus shoreicorticis]